MRTGVFSMRVGEMGNSRSRQPSRRAQQEHQPSRYRQRCLLVQGYVLALFVLTSGSQFLLAQSAGDESDNSGKNTSAAVAELSTELITEWQCSLSPARTVVDRDQITVEGEPLTRFRVASESSSEAVRLVAGIEPSLLHYDFFATVRVHSTLVGSRLAVEVLVPGQTDPVTGLPLVLYLPGDAIESDNRFYALTVSVTERSLQAALRTARAERNRPDISAEGAVITGLAILTETSPGESWTDIGLAEYGPVIRLPDRISQQMRVLAASSTLSANQERSYVPMDVELGALLLEGRPGIMRLIPDHGESTDLIRGLGINTVWLSDYRDRLRAREWALARTAVMTSPPHPQFKSEEYSTVLRSVPPLDQLCPDISAWYLGTRVSPTDLPYLLALTRDLRSSDRVFQRPQLADVVGAEGAVSREIDLIGMGRHVVGREEGFGSLRNLLYRRWRNSGQQAFPWTWIQIEHSAAQQSWRRGMDPPLVEPEQVLHQVHAALSAGYRGVGFWKTREFDRALPHDREIMLAIELACLEIRLLEPFLAEGRHEGVLTLQSSEEPSELRGRSSSAARAGRSIDVSQDYEAVQSDAAVIRSDRTSLILAAVWDDASQFVPAPMFRQEMNAVVAASETASAWEVSVTGVHSMPREVVAGGLRIRLRNFDRAATVIVTSSPAVVQELEQKILLTAPRAARLWIELSTLKAERVETTLEEIAAIQPLPPGVTGLLENSRTALDLAEQEIRTGNHDEARMLAQDSLRYLRQIQSLCWRDAVRNLCSPTSSPHTISFSTLANHWEQLRFLAANRHRVTGNLLPGGDFDNSRNILREGWTREEQAGTGFSTTCDLMLSGARGRLLRIAAWYNDPQRGNGGRDDLVPLVLRSPQVPAQAGDLMIVTGRVRRGASVSVPVGTQRPLLIYDSELGPEQGLRLKIDSDWMEFQMLRPMRDNGDFQLLLSLHGQCEVHFDDLQIRCLPAAGESPQNDVQPEGAMRQLLRNMQVLSDDTGEERLQVQPAASRRQ